MSGIGFDVTDFNRQFNNVTTKIPKTAIQEGKKQGAEIIRDAIKEEPRAPHDTGGLWRSQKVEQKGDEIKAGFDINYASAVHERVSPTNWTLKGSGAKFLETKVIRYKEKYAKNIADGIKKEGGL